VPLWQNINFQKRSEKMERTARAGPSGQITAMKKEETAIPASRRKKGRTKKT